MPDKNWDWVDDQEQQNKENRGKDYFDIVEGKQQFVLLSHFARYAQVWDGSKYRAAEEGDTNISAKGVCWVYQDGAIKLAKMPYTIVKAVRALHEDPEWDFELPFLHTLTLNAVGAGTKEVKYTLTPSPRKVELDPEVLKELAKKPSPEEMVEKLSGTAVSPSKPEESGYEYPEEEIDPADIPF